MDHAPTFARHLARLVWQLLTASDDYDLQLASLQLLVGASRAGAVTIGVTGQTLLANGAPLGDGGPEAEDLVAQLIGHSIHQIAFDQPSSPADVLLVARILATPPIAGDGGRSVVARLDSLEARTVRVSLISVDAPPARTSTPPAIGTDVIRGASAGCRDMARDMARDALSPSSSGKTTTALS